MKALNLGTLWHNEIMIKQNSNKTKSRLYNFFTVMDFLSAAVLKLCKLVFFFFSKMAAKVASSDGGNNELLCLQLC